MLLCRVTQTTHHQPAITTGVAVDGKGEEIVWTADGVEGRTGTVAHLHLDGRTNMVGMDPATMKKS